MKIDLLKNLNFSRALRLIIGVVVVVNAINSRDAMIGLLGALFVGMAVLNVGCCGTASCYTPLKKTKIPSEDISFEEVK